MLFVRHVAYYVGSGDGIGTPSPRAFRPRGPNRRDVAPGDRGEAMSLVTDEMVHDLGVAGTPETAKDRSTTSPDRSPPIDRGDRLTDPEQAGKRVRRKRQIAALASVSQIRDWSGSVPV